MGIKEKIYGIGMESKWIITQVEIFAEDVAFHLLNIGRNYIFINIYVYYIFMIRRILELFTEVLLILMSIKIPFNL